LSAGNVESKVNAVMTEVQQPAEVAESAGRGPGRRLALVVAAVLIAFAMVAGFGVADHLGGGKSTEGATASTGSTGSKTGDTDAALNPAANGDQSTAIAGLQATLKTSPGNAAAWATLALDYVDQARVTVNPQYDTMADGAVKKSLAIDSTDNFIGDAAAASLAAARHQFAEARSYALKGIAIDGYNASLYGILADAQTQLGQYAAAAASVQKMINLRPQVPALSRASYVAELAGNLPSAVSLMTQARDAASTPDDTAFADYYLGELARNAGDPTKAMTYYQAGLQVDPSYAALYEGKAKAEAALGLQTAAIADYNTVVSRVPQPQYVIEFGEYLQSLGKTALAQQQYATFGIENQLFQANGVLLDSDPTLYYADHGDPAKAMQFAKVGIRIRPFLEMDDAYAWALHVNGQDAEALTWSHKALATGMSNALFHFHQGMIEKSLGDKAAAVKDLTAALTINPGFNPLQEPVAKKALQQLGSAS
jgi:tetratricopeptide (TPR) repeat protein